MREALCAPSAHSEAEDEREPLHVYNEAQVRPVEILQVSVSNYEDTSVSFLAPISEKDEVNRRWPVVKKTMLCAGDPSSIDLPTTVSI